MKYQKKDLHLDYETIPILTQWVRRFILYPFINHIIPKGFIMRVINGSDSMFLKELSRGPGSWRTMMLSYAKEMPKNGMDRWIYEHGSFPVGLRNRKKMVAELLSEQINRHLTSGDVNIVTVGAGTGIHTIEAMSKVNAKNVKAYLFDFDDAAFPVGKELSREYALSDRIEFFQADIRDMSKYVHVKPNILEMIGIAEYLTDEQIQGLITTVNEQCSKDGSLIINTLLPSHGVDPFFKRVLNFHLFYRSTDQMIHLLEKCGYGNFTTTFEPSGLYSIITADRVSGIQSKKQETHGYVNS